MKRLLILAIGMWIMAVGCVNAQTLEQKKICALKWTLQQTFYNKAEGQQMAHLDVTKFKSFDEFKKDALVSKMISKVSDGTDKRRVENIINAKSDADFSVPGGAKKEYQSDLEKIKAVVPETDETPAEDEVATEEETTEEVTEAAVTPVQQEQAAPEPTNDDAATADDADEEEEAISPTSSGIGVWGAILISVVVYIVLTICLALFKRSRRTNLDEEDPSVSMEQYRSERLRLIERIKAIEIKLDNMKAANADNGNKPSGSNKPHQSNQPATKPTPAPVSNPQPAKPQAPKQEPVGPQPAPQTATLSFAPDDKPVEQGLFDAPSAEVIPIIQPTEAASSIKPSQTKSIMFFPVPVDGVFTNGTEDIEPGKSLYMLRTADGENATFTILNTPEAIGTALISLTEKVKPVCKIINTVSNPLEIVTEGPGTAVREGDSWKMVTKSVVRLL